MVTDYTGTLYWPLRPEAMVCGIPTASGWILMREPVSSWECHHTVDENTTGLTVCDIYAEFKKWDILIYPLFNFITC